MLGWRRFLRFALPAFAGDVPAVQHFGAPVTVQKPTNMQKPSMPPTKFQGQKVVVQGLLTTMPHIELAAAASR